MSADADDPRAAFEAWTARLVASAKADEQILGIVLAGSGAEPERLDEWSDHDFFVVVSADPELHRTKLAWLPDRERVALRARETEHGQKIVLDDGHVLEFAVATPDEMTGWAVNHAAVVFDRGGVAELIAALRNDTVAGTVDAGRELSMFVALLLIGVGRDRRGERLAAGRFVRGHALEHLLLAWRELAPSDAPDTRDGLDVHRRFEVAYPEAGAVIAEALAQHPEPAARDLLDFAEREFAASEHWPVGGVTAVRARLGWDSGR